MEREPEARAPRGLRNPPEIQSDYVQRHDTENIDFESLSNIPLIELVEGECPFPFEEYDALKQGPFPLEIMKSGERYDYAHEKNTINIKNHIIERFGLNPDKSEIILSGNGSAGIIRNSLDLLPSPPLKSQLFVIGPSFPFILSSSLSKRDQNRTINSLGPKEQNTEMGLINIDIKGEGIGTIFMPLGVRTEEALIRTMGRRGQVSFKRPVMYYFCNPNTPQGDVIPFERVKEFSGFAAERGDIVFIDEAYGDWIDDSESAMQLTSELPNIIATRTLSKPFRLASWRIGYSAMSKEIGKRYMTTQRNDPFSLSGPQQLITEFTLDPKNVRLHLDGEDEFGNVVKRGIREKTKSAKEQFVNQLKERGVLVLPTDMRTPIFTIGGMSDNFYDNLKKEGVACAPGIGFNLTHDEMDNSFVRAIIPPDEKSIPEIVEKIYRASVSD